MTDAEAEALLAKLSEHYKVPVMPITRYCSALRTWQDAFHARADRAREELWPSSSTNETAFEAMKLEVIEVRRAKGADLTARGSAVLDFLVYEEEAERVDEAFFQIHKSNLLWRLLYGGEALRTRPCPEHKGVWSGVPHEPPACGCGLTGWLPEPSSIIVIGPPEGT